MRSLGPQTARKRTVVIGLLVVSAGMLATVAIDQVRAISRPRPIPPSSVATALQQAGVVRGMRVAIIGNKALHEYWARLDRVRIVAQVTEDRGFWVKPRESQEALVRALAQTGAHAIVASRTPIDAGSTWTVAGDTGYSLRLLTDADRAVAPGVR